MDFPVTVNLKRPLSVGDQDIKSLTFDEPDLGTSIEVEEAKTPWGQTVILLAGMAGVSVEAIKRVKESDYREITRLVLDPYQQLQKDRAAEDAASGNVAAAT